MKNLILHKYFTVNLFVYINLICILNFVTMLCSYLASYKNISFVPEPIIHLGIIVFFIVPIVIWLMILECILRQCDVIKKSCMEIFTQLQIKIIYFIAIVLLIAYLINLIRYIVY